MFTETLEVHLGEHIYFIEATEIHRDDTLVYFARIWYEGALINAEDLRESKNPEEAIDQGMKWLKEYKK